MPENVSAAGSLDPARANNLTNIPVFCWPTIGYQTEQHRYWVCAPPFAQLIARHPMALALMTFLVSCMVYFQQPYKEQTRAKHGHPVKGIQEDVLRKRVDRRGSHVETHSKSERWFMDHSKMASNISEAI